ncbi:hypothetical protein D3C75_798350 [compost metagenome]
MFFNEFDAVFSVFAVVEAFYGGDVSALLRLDGGLFEVAKAGEAELHHKSPQGRLGDVDFMTNINHFAVGNGLKVFVKIVDDTSIRFGQIINVSNTLSEFRSVHVSFPLYVISSFINNKTQGRKKGNQKFPCQKCVSSLIPF